MVAWTVKRLPTVRETWVQSLGWEDLLEKEMATHSSILAGESHGWSDVVGHNPQGRKELDTTERLHFHFHLSVWVGKCLCCEGGREQVKGRDLASGSPEG